MHRGSGQRTPGRFMLRAPLFQYPMQLFQQCDIALVGAVQRPAESWQRERAGVDQVAALPAWLKFLFEIEERAVFVRIAEMLCQEIDAVSQEGMVGAIDITERGKAEAHDVGSLFAQVFDGTCQQAFHRAGGSVFGAAHQVESPALASINWYEGHEGMNPVLWIDCQGVDLLGVAIGVEASHAESHLRAALARQPATRNLFHLR